MYSFSDELRLTGYVGGYYIDMWIDSTKFDTGDIYGRYRYLSQESFIDLKGKNYNNEVLVLEEFWNEDHTGTFYLDIMEDSLIGWWKNEKEAYDVNLYYKSGELDLLEVQSLEDMNFNCSDDISGTYKIGQYYVDSYFATNENLYYDLGFNGGTAIFKETENGDLEFKIVMSMGQPVHLAQAEGVAMKKGDTYRYYHVELEGYEGCEIIFTFDNKKVHAISNNVQSCLFGVNASIDHTLYKINDGFKDFLDDIK
ncbi:MAG: hypothetical protein C0596_04215 [Marinilabiliales bacterium]|nr:MAG: hypothetical protein C0596_04215 [Marinilabiliales bacterium]